MTFKPKNLLLILELNETLAFIKNFRSKIKDFSSDAYKIKYDVEANNFGLLFRNGRPQFLEYLFSMEKQAIDVGVWSSLDSNMTQLVSQKYFGRYYRDLLFVLSTNRGLYAPTGCQPQDSLKIPKQLNSVYSNFPGYNSANTLVLTCQKNTLEEHIQNDMIIPAFSPKNQTFETDVGCLAVTKYLKGGVFKLKDKTLQDVRSMNTGRPLQTLYRRLTHGVYSPTKYG